MDTFIFFRELALFYQGSHTLCKAMQSLKKQEFQKNIYFCFIDYAKAFVWITINWKILKEMGIPDHLTCFLRNLYAG